MAEHVHTVKEGDTLSEISQYYYRDMKYYTYLAKFNNIRNPDLITVGQKIKIPTYLMAGSEKRGGNPVLNLVRVSSSKVKKHPQQSDICIAFFFDGTGKNRDVDVPKGCESNVAKLFELFQERKDDATNVEFQKACYLNGVGTDEKWYSDLPGLIAGFGGQNRIANAFRTLGDFVKTHKDSKQIFVDVFGHSRGAALARHFVNVIHDFGIYDRDAQPIGTKKVTCHIDGQNHTTEIPIYPKYQNVVVRFLGLFDTVGSFGLAGNDVDIGWSAPYRLERFPGRIRYA